MILPLIIFQGDQGQRGSPGTDGVTGISGPPGPNGEPGETGVIGETVSSLTIYSVNLLCCLFLSRIYYFGRFPRFECLEQPAKLLVVFGEICLRTPSVTLPVAKFLSIKIC